MKSHLKVTFACIVALVLGLYLQLFGLNLPIRQAVHVGSTDGGSEIEGLLFPRQKDLREFQMIDSHHNSYGLSDLEGSWSFLFFGYTHCPDICPITMNSLRQVQDFLAKDVTENPTENPAENPVENPTENSPRKTQFLFVSVDGERDTPPHLEQYIQYFGDGFTALTGNKKQVDSLTNQLGVPYEIEKHDTGEDYLVAHSGAIFLISPQTKLTAIYQPPHNPEEMAQRFRDIINFIDGA